MAIEPYTDAQIDEALAQLPAWTLSDDRVRIRRAVKFDGFPAAFAFMTAVALEAQRLDHHPDWSNSWATVRIELTDHTTGGLTYLDFELAAKIDAHAVAAGATPID